VILQYEDDVFVTVQGKAFSGWIARRQHAAYKRILNRISGCIGVSPHLLSQTPSTIPTLLLRGVVGDDVFEAGNQADGIRKNWVVFAGTHIESNGVQELITAWKLAGLLNWELHISGFGQLTEQLRKTAEGDPSIVFHGFLSREELVRLISSAKICANPHALSETPGNVFAFKIIEYLAAGAHVITTPMGTLEPELEQGVTYIPNNRPETIATALNGSSRIALMSAHGDAKQRLNLRLVNGLESLDKFRNRRRVAEFNTRKPHVTTTVITDVYRKSPNLASAVVSTDSADASCQSQQRIDTRPF
jgi:glycosyltransferase involved in cell wall biosynthesis